MRHRKVDRSILDQNEPLDSEDQELLISQLAGENDSSLRLYKKVLVLSVLVEIPPLVFLARAVSVTPSVKVVLPSLLLLLNILTVVNTVFNVGAVSSVLPDTAFAQMLGKLITFKSVCVMNGVIVCQLLYVAFGREKLGWVGIFTVVPVGNLITLILLRTWHDSISKEFRSLHDLKYKFKTA